MLGLQISFFFFPRKTCVIYLSVCPYENKMHVKAWQKTEFQKWQISRRRDFLYPLGERRDFKLKHVKKDKKIKQSEKTAFICSHLKICFNSPENWSRQYSFKRRQVNSRMNWRFVSFQFRLGVSFCESSGVPVADIPKLDNALPKTPMHSIFPQVYSLQYHAEVFSPKCTQYGGACPAHLLKSLTSSDTSKYLRLVGSYSWETRGGKMWLCLPLCVCVCNTVITTPAEKILPVLRYYRDFSTILYCGE